jgi:hypothetical protein
MESTNVANSGYQTLVLLVLKLRSPFVSESGTHTERRIKNYTIKPLFERYAFENLSFLVGDLYPPLLLGNNS